MKVCPKCQAEVEDQFDLCWKCNYSFSAGKIAEIRDERECDIECLRCKVSMYYEGNYDFRKGVLVETEKNFDVYVCPECGKAEFFLPQRELLKRKRKYENLNR